MKRMHYMKFLALLSTLVLYSLANCVFSQQQDAASQEQSRPRQVREPSSQSTPTLKHAEGNEESKDQNDEVVTIETDLANVLFTAVDKNRRFMTTIQKEDIRVLEDGQAQEIFTFQRETNLPLSLAILVDVSASQQLTLEDEKDAARAFVNSVVHHAKDEVAVISFSGEATIEQGLTNRLSSVQKALERIEIVLPPGYVGRGIIINSPARPSTADDDPRLGTTAIWDAVWAVSEELFSDVQKDKRRAIILITDGVDTSSRLKTDEAIKRAITEDVAVYAVGIGDDINFEGIKKSSLRKIAERTGGRAYFPRNNAELQGSFSQIEQELRSQYLVAYSPSNKNHDGSYRKVEIELVNPELRKEKLQLNYRQGYFAKGTSATRARTPQQ
ncbi:MAG TPA: VWA domain-containing protein [Pyrinomonadaceae bacterium]